MIRLKQHANRSRRLTSVLGADTCVWLADEIRTGGLKTTREASLYFDRLDGRFVTPRGTFTQSRARELLLLAIETSDDSLVGYSNHTMAERDRIDSLFDHVAAETSESNNC